MGGRGFLKNVCVWEGGGGIQKGEGVAGNVGVGGVVNDLFWICYFDSIFLLIQIFIWIVSVSSPY